MADAFYPVAGLSCAGWRGLAMVQCVLSASRFWAIASATRPQKPVERSAAQDGVKQGEVKSCSSSPNPSLCPVEFDRGLG